jgi:hypothetical protein
MYLFRLKGKGREHVTKAVQNHVQGKPLTKRTKKHKNESCVAPEWRKVDMLLSGLPFYFLGEGVVLQPLF